MECTGTRDLLCWLTFAKSLLLSGHWGMDSTCSESLRFPIAGHDGSDAREWHVCVHTPVWQGGEGAWLYMCPFAVDGDVTPGTQNPCRQTAMQLPVTMSLRKSLACFGKSEKQLGRQVNRNKNWIASRSGHFFPRLLGRYKGAGWAQWVAATPSLWKREWQAQTLLRGASGQPGLSVNVLLLNWIQLLSWNLILTNAFLG